MPKTLTVRSPGRARWVAWLAVSLLVAAVDQLSKIIVQHALSVGERLSICPLVDLTLVYNPGAAFSLLSHASGWQRWLFTGIAAAAIIAIIVLLARYSTQRVFATALALILGGAIGNVADRIVSGRVVDFILVYWRDWYWPAFNLADSAITIGATLLILDEIRRVRTAR